MEVIERANNKCELCGAAESLVLYVVSPKEEEIAICTKCQSLIDEDPSQDTNHWRSLSESMWSAVPAVQVTTYRLLHKLSETGWAADLLGQMYLDEDTLAWAEQSVSTLNHKDCNGNVLANGDTVTLIQDLNVKGANFTAKRGTAVRKIRLVIDNVEQIEGKVEGQQIVLLTKYVKKA